MLDALLALLLFVLVAAISLSHDRQRRRLICRTEA